MRTMTLDSYIAHLRAIRAAFPAAEHRALERAAKIIEAEAKAEVGHYQDAAGPFAAWEELAPSTKKDRAAKGFPENNPLLRSGELLHSISHKIEGHKVIVGSPLDIAVYQEFGTSHAAHPIPPRSFLGAAAFRKGAEAAKAAGKELARALVGKPPLP